MHYASIKKLDIANGDGVRVSLFVSGCRNHCEGCFQPETWNFAYGKPFTAEVTETILTALEPSYVEGLTLLGGEPFEPENQRELVALLRLVKQRFPAKNVWCFTGYTLEEILGEEHPHCEASAEMLSMIDVLVDGRFEADKKDISLKFRGSANQRILDVPKSLQQGRAVAYYH